MLTVFSCPKSFLGPIRLIQRNAIQSWLNLGPEVEVVLMGDDEGTSEVLVQEKLLNGAPKGMIKIQNRGEGFGGGNYYCGMLLKQE